MARDPAELGWPGYRVRQVQRWIGEVSECREDAIAEEAPVALMYNGQPHVVMLATPLDLEDFAIGFSLTEGIVNRPSEITSIGVFERSQGIEVRLRIPASQKEALSGFERNLAGRTGCGLCGAQTLEQAVKRPRRVAPTAPISSAALASGLGQIHAGQRLNALTGAVHAAAWLVPGDEALIVREDVGRHNALDKLIGALARQGRDLSAGGVLVTSRASFEMVQKCGMVGIGFLAAISAPTGLAIRLAEESGVTLVGFARDHSHVVYAHPYRLLHAVP